MHYTRDDKMQTQFRKMEEEIMTKDFLPVVMPVSRMQISIDGKKLNEFYENHVVCEIRSVEKEMKDQEEIVDEADFGTDVIEETEDEDTEQGVGSEDTDVQEERKRKAEAKSNWARYQSFLMECIIAFRKENGKVSRVTRTNSDRTKVVILMIEGLSKDAVEQILSEKRKDAVFPVSLSIMENPAAILFQSEFVNLLFGLLPYHYAKVSENQYPYGGYQVFAKAASSSGKNSPVKSSFANVYLGMDGLLYCSLKPYYQRGPWIDRLSEEQRMESENAMAFHKAPTGEDDFLTRGVKADGDYTDIYCWSRNMKKGLVGVRSLFGEKGIQSHLETKQVIVDRALYRFRSIYGDMIQMCPEKWNAWKHWTEVTTARGASTDAEKKNGTKQIEERNMQTINEIRTILEEGGGLAIQYSKDVNETFIDRAEMIRQQMSDLYSYATYKGSIASSKGFLKGEKIRILDVNEHEEGYSIARVAAICQMVKEKKETGKEEKEAILLEAALENGYWMFEVPANTKTMNLEIRIQQEYDVPLPAERKIPYIKYLNGKEQRGSRMFRYDSGFGLKYGTILRECPTDDFLQICLIPDNKSKQYKEAGRLSVQHFGIEDLKAGRKKDDDLTNKIQKTFYEIAIRRSLLDNDIPVRGNLVSALYAYYVPSKRAGQGRRTRAHYRYFLFLDGRISELRKEELRTYTNLFPNMFQFLETDELKMRDHQYIVKTLHDTYYLRRTNMVPFGNSEIDEDGNLKPPHSKGVEVLTNEMPGGFGITFYHENRDLQDVIYYCVAGNQRAQDLKGDGMARYPHIYEVHHDQAGEPDYHELYEMLSDPIVKLKQYTSRPSIFKYMDECIRCSGRR